MKGGGGGSNSPTPPEKTTLKKPNLIRLKDNSNYYASIGNIT